MALILFLPDSMLRHIADPLAEAHDATVVELMDDDLCGSARQDEDPPSKRLGARA